ncbi:hypothetical protein CDAR_53531 [Caerostris darwini]|uniref:Maturase K n=1 Tax=Caerostris darwini TaxID=1538125 RepID=A0AAV4T9J4_9ARAC|nr:hypothetical protein CDAR_53531 [Caerostris darwini]
MNIGISMVACAELFHVVSLWRFNRVLDVLPNTTDEKRLLIASECSNHKSLSRVLKTLPYRVLWWRPEFTIRELFWSIFHYKNKETITLALFY